MKKIITLFVVILICLSTSVVFGAGKLSVTQENFHVINSYSTIYGYAYAKVENVGDKPIKINAGLLEIFDEEGDTITSSDYLRKYAEYLQPDEYSYVYLSEKIDNIETTSDVDDYMLTITGKSDSDKYSLRLPVETSYLENVKESSYSTRSFMDVKVTNNTEETIFDVNVVLVLLDDDDNILYLETESMNSNKGITPGSSVIVHEAIPSNFVDYFTLNDYKPTKVDAIAYVNLNSN